MTAAVSVQDLSVVFSTSGKLVPALGPISFEILPGEFVSIIGPSGCGKTTLARVLTNLTPAGQGRFEIHTEVDNKPTIAIVPQEFSLLPWKTATDNVAYGLIGRSAMSKPDKRVLAIEWLTRMGLEEFANHYPEHLSGGMKQRVAIARALASEPDLLVMDEPFASLDAQTRELMQEQLLDSKELSAVTTLLITHSLEEAIFLSDRILVLSSRPGTIVEDVRVDLPRDQGSRVPTSDGFLAIRKSLREVLRQQVTKPQALQDQRDELAAPSF